MHYIVFSYNNINNKIYKAFEGTPVQNSYQQWTIFGNQLTYCGLIGVPLKPNSTEMTDVNPYQYMASPQFVYEPAMSSEYELYFCADPRGGGCSTFHWQWIYYNDTNQLLWKNSLGGMPHEETLLSLNRNINPNDVPVGNKYREVCAGFLGHEFPYNYHWLDIPDTNITNGDDIDCARYEPLTNKNRHKLINSIPNYRENYQIRKKYKYHH